MSIVFVKYDILTLINKQQIISYCFSGLEGEVLHTIDRKF